MNILTPHQQRVLTTSGHLALTANAGSGKTFVLARKYLSALMQEDLEISNVAAITFTEKAASELYSKISRLIDEQIKIETVISEKKKLEKIRRQLISANISTIHSFCTDILRTFPVEARLDARFVPIDENLSSELIEMSVEETMRSSFEDELLSNEIKYLIRLFSNMQRLGSEIVRLIKNRKNVFALRDTVYSGKRECIVKHFKESFSDLFLKIWLEKKSLYFESLSGINSAVLGNDPSNLSAYKIKESLTRLAESNDVYDIIRLLEEIRTLVFTKQGSIRRTGYLKTSIGTGLGAETAAAEEINYELKSFSLPPDSNAIEEELADFGLIVLKIFNAALNKYEYKKRSEGFVDYEDILIHTKILLENENVQKLLREKFRLIMVDEFQDTNEIQYQIFLPILDYLKNGNLFIVGDEKQSIYKFRDAEIEIFNQTRNEIKICAGENNLLVLPDSFRMAPAICTFCNYIFGRLFSNPNELYGEVAATDLVCARNDQQNGKVGFLINNLSENSAASAESDLVAAGIMELISDAGYSFRDICILVRKRKHFNDLERSLLANNIPYSIAGGRGFYQRQSISDIYNYLSFLADENNSPALAGVLRSPFFSLSDARLYQISLCEGDSLWNKYKNYISVNREDQNIVRTLSENLSLCRSMELPVLLKKIVTDRNYISILSERKDGIQEIANIEKLITIARNFNSKGFRSLYDFITYLGDSISGIDDESQAAIPDQTDSVQIMTIHQAKGLEFPVVFLYRTADQGLSGSIKTGQIQVSKKFGLLSKLPVRGNFPDEFYPAPIVVMHNFLEEKKNNAELKRLLYVALTRARDELYISASLEPDKTFAKDSFIRLLGEGLESDFREAEISVEKQLNYLIKNDESYSASSKNYLLKIGVRNQITSLPSTYKNKNGDEAGLEIGTGRIESSEKGEIISATKVSIYNQCPLKYYLTYESGFGKLNSGRLGQGPFRNSSRIPESEDEHERDLEFTDFSSDKSKGYDPALYGKIVHTILERNISPADFEEYLSVIKPTDENINTRLRRDLVKYFKSDTFKEIKSLTNYKNEYEIYIKDNGHYLHGIVDKLVLDGNRIRIFDYKTDDIKENQIKKQAELYLMQLKFYLYIASKLFEGFELFEGNLIFIQHPDIPVRISYSKGEIPELNQEINSVVSSVRDRKITKNILHCPECPYSGFTSGCIINSGDKI